MFIVQGLVQKLRDETAAISARGTWVQLSGSGTHTVPAGVTLYYLYACGGGAGGQGSYNKGTSDGNSGGAGATLWRVPILVAPGDEISYSVGAAGAAGTASAYPTAGGTTTFGDWYAPGGERSNASGAENPAGGAIPPRWAGLGINGDSASNTKGGDSVFGVGGDKGTPSTAPNGVAGSGYGSGGGGREYTGSGSTGGAGTPGVIFLERG